MGKGGAAHLPSCPQRHLHEPCLDPGGRCPPTLTLDDGMGGKEASGGFALALAQPMHLAAERRQLPPVYERGALQLFSKRLDLLRRPLSDSIGAAEGVRLALKLEGKRLNLSVLHYVGRSETRRLCCL